MPEEIALGGNLQDAVRIGDTVHRRAGPWTPSVHALLRFLEGAGFPAPRVIGMDAQGREVLRFIEGQDWHSAASQAEPHAIFAEKHLVAAAKLLRRYHDVVAAFRPLPNAKWRVVAPTPYEVICHNDWSPWNTLIRDGGLALVLDWDLAGPGTRTWDVATAIYNWVPFFAHPIATDPKAQARRMRLFLDNYGLKDRSDLLLTLRTRLRFMGELVAREAAAGDPGMQRLVAMDAPKTIEDSMAWLDKNWATLQRAL